MNKYLEYARAKKLPRIPASIRPLPFLGDDDVPVQATVIGGINVVGEEGHVCPTVSLIGADPDSGTLFGWSLCIGHPDSRVDEVPYHFRTSGTDGAGTARGTELPDTMVYFQAAVDAALADPEADREKVEEVIAYVLPHISDGGPPPADGKSFGEWVAEAPTSAAEQRAACELKRKISTFLDRAGEQLEGTSDLWALFDGLNKGLYRSGLAYAWKADPATPDHNPELGVIERLVGGRRVVVSIGLSRDGFTGPCAVVHIVDRP